MPSPRRASLTLTPFLASTLTAILVAALVPAPASAQEPGVKIAVGDVGIGIGDVPRIDGLRLNFRDRHLDRVRGLNLTIWTPYEESHGVVEGVAVGLPLAGAAEIRGLALGAGVAVQEEFTGMGVTGVGMGSGGGLRGIVVAGIGAGAGGDMEGLGLAGLGLGAGGSLAGVAIGGIGVGAGGSIRGIAIGGVGVGAGGDITGLAIGGVGVGSGGELRGIGVGGLGVGAPRMTGLMLSGLGAGGEDVRGVVVAPAYFRIEENGRLRGVSVSAYNDIRGEQRGLSIGLINIAEELHGLQLGLINIARNKDRFPVLPLANYHP